MTEQEFLTVQGIPLAFNRHRSPGAKVGLLFLGGFASDKEGSKALALESLALARGYDFLRFDYLAHGKSGGDFQTQGSISRWLDDATAMLNTQTQGPQVLIGSSMGGWLALLLAQRRPERVQALVGLAAAADFATELTPKTLGAAALREIDKRGVYFQPTPYGPDPYIWTRLLLEDAKRHRVLDGTLSLPCPLHLIQGQKDPDVPWRHALKTIEALRAPQISLTLLADGDHRLSREQDLSLICATVRAYAEPESYTSGHKK